MLASAYGQTEIVKLLLKYKAQVNMQAHVRVIICTVYADLLFADNYTLLGQSRFQFHFSGQL